MLLFTYEYLWMYKIVLKQIRTTFMKSVILVVYNECGGG